MKLFFKCLTLLAIIISTCSLSYAAPNKTKKTNDTSYLKAKIQEGALNGVAYSLNNHVYGYNMDTFFHPASTEKVLTALAALIYLGPDYRFETRLNFPEKNLKNNTPVVQNNVFNNSIEIEFGGDPTLTSGSIYELIAVLKQLGITKIQGNIYLNHGHFEGHDYAPGWSWNDLEECFSAPPSSIIIDRNCASLKLIGTKIGQNVTLDIPQGSPIKADASQVEVVTLNEFYSGCELKVNRNTANMYVFSGCIPVQKPNQPLGKAVAIMDPIQLASNTISKALAKYNITLTGQIVPTRKSYFKFTTYARQYSDTLHTILNRCLKRSDNLIADIVAREIGSVYYKRPTNYAMSTKAIMAILKKNGIDLNKATIVDGSGLSHYNFITPRQMLGVLNYIKNNDKKLNMISLFPVAGVSGTLGGRGSVMQPPLLKNVTAKTGTLNGVANLAGFLTSKNGQLIPFVYFMNNLSYDERTGNLLRAHRIAKPHYRHERKILEAIYDERQVLSPQ